MSVECPYCEVEQEINHDEGYGFTENELHEQECGNCYKTFTYNTSIIYHYESYKAGCLNGEEHQFEPTTTYPKFLTKMECKTCEGKRIPSEEERIKHDIPLKYEV